MVGKMTLDKITPDDERITHHSVDLNGRQYRKFDYTDELTPFRYHQDASLTAYQDYVEASPPASDIKGTIILVHGFPDLWLAWRYQIPTLLSLNLRVIAIDCIGYGATSAPPDISEYTFKRTANDIAALAAHLNSPQIILGGHDWGGLVVYRTAQWHPDLVTHVFSVCTPFMPISKRFVPLDQVVQALLPQFGYQLHFAGPEVEGAIQSEADIRQFLQGMYGGRTAGGEPFFRPETGLDLSQLGKIGMTPLLDEAEMAYYSQQYARNGVHGPTNWYRTRQLNFEDELELEQKTVSQPTLFVQALDDNVLTPEMSVGMEKYIPTLTRREVKASHWALWQAATEVNAFIKEWMETEVFATARGKGHGASQL